MNENIYSLKHTCIECIKTKLLYIYRIFMQIVHSKVKTRLL